MVKHDYLPSKEAELIDWVDNFLAEITKNGQEWGIPQDETAEIKKLFEEFRVLHTECAGPNRTHALVAEKDAANTALTGKIRAMVGYRFAAPVITDAIRVRCGLHPKDRVRTTIPPPLTRSLITELKALGGFRVQIRFQDEATPGSRAIPYGMNGCLLSYAWGPEKATDYAALKDTKLMTANPWVLQLPPEAEGAFLSCAARWQNNKGDLGPWSEIMFVAVS